MSKCVKQIRGCDMKRSSDSAALSCSPQNEILRLLRLMLELSATSTIVRKNEDSWRAKLFHDKFNDSRCPLQAAVAIVERLLFPLMPLRDKSKIRILELVPNATPNSCITSGNPSWLLPINSSSRKSLLAIFSSVFFCAVFY